MDGADVGIDVGSLADERDDVLFPRMTEMRDDHPEVRKVHRDVLELDRARPAEPRPAREGRALVPHDRDAESLRALEQWPVATVGWIEVLVGRPQLEAAQAERPDGVIEL